MVHQPGGWGTAMEILDLEVLTCGGENYYTVRAGNAITKSWHTGDGSRVTSSRPSPFWVVSCVVTLSLEERAHRPSFGRRGCTTTLTLTLCDRFAMKSNMDSVHYELIHSTPHWTTGATDISLQERTLIPGLACACVLTAVAAAGTRHSGYARGFPENTAYYYRFSWRTSALAH